MMSASHGLDISLQRFKGDVSRTLSTFPEEIVKSILECLGRESWSEAVGLVVVSRLVHRWILPVLYETIRIERASDLYQVQSNITAHPELASHVRNVCLQFAGQSRSTRRARDVATLFAQCPHIRTIYLPDSTSLAVHQTVVQLPRLEELHYGSWTWWPITTFRALTHLLLDDAYDLTRPPWASLRAEHGDALPQLTHVAFRNGDGRSTSQFVQEVLAARPRLVMLVVVSHMVDDNQMMFESVADRRLSVLIKPPRIIGVSSVRQWEDVVRGRQNIWSMAEAVIKRRTSSVSPGLSN